MIPISALQSVNSIIGHTGPVTRRLAWHYTPLHRLPAILAAGYLRAHDHADFAIYAREHDSAIVLDHSKGQRRPTLFFTVNAFMEPSIGPHVWCWKNALDDAMNAAGNSVNLTTRIKNTMLARGLIDAIRKDPNAWQ